VIKLADHSKTFNLVKSECKGQANGLDNTECMNKKSNEIHCWYTRSDAGKRKSNPGLTKSGSLLAFGGGKKGILEL